MTKFLQLAFVAVIVFAGSASAQDLKVTMSFSQRTFLGNTFPAGPAVICTGYPTCRGDLALPPEICGTVSTVVTGLNLGQSGGVGGTISQKTVYCQNLQPVDLVYHYSGSWNLAANLGTF